MSNQSVCDMVKDCAISGECDQAQPHDCGDYKCDTGTRFCDVHPESRCKPVELPLALATVKPKGSRSILMKDVINENVTLKIALRTEQVDNGKLQAEIGRLNAENAGLRAEIAERHASTFTRLVRLVKGGAA